MAGKSGMAGRSWMTGKNWMAGRMAGRRPRRAIKLLVGDPLIFPCTVTAASNISSISRSFSYAASKPTSGVHRQSPTQRSPSSLLDFRGAMSMAYRVHNWSKRFGKDAAMLIWNVWSRIKRVAFRASYTMYLVN